MSTGAGWLAKVSGWLERDRWVVPIASFLLGVGSFVLFERGAAMAQYVALLVLASWLWIPLENVTGEWLLRKSRGRLSPKLLKYLTQGLHQEALFFSLPFVWSVTSWNSTQCLFFVIVAAAALLASIDPLYLDWLGRRKGLRIAFHALCTFVAMLVILPLALLLPTDKALPVALALTAALSVPMLLRLSAGRLRLTALASVPLIAAAVWLLRGWVPPAGLWLTQARITAQVNQGPEPGPERSSFTTAELAAHGVAAFVAIRAPQGLDQGIEFDWFHRGRPLDHIRGEIHGGRQAGFRTYSRKTQFPADPTGEWRVDLRTPLGQLVHRYRFTVTQE